MINGICGMHRHRATDDLRSKRRMFVLIIDHTRHSCKSQATTGILRVDIS